MRHSFGKGSISLLVVVATWRALSQLWLRMRELTLCGELAVRRARRHASAVDRQLRCARARDERGDSIGVVQFRARGVHASVHVGAAPDAHDIDDMGLLEAAMRRAARLPTETVADLEAGATDNARVPRWSMALVASGLVMTLIPLVRPLADAAPWLALAGFALVAAGALAARRG